VRVFANDRGEPLNATSETKSRFGRIAARVLALAFGLLAAELILEWAGADFSAWDRPVPGLYGWGIPNAEGWAVYETRRWVKIYVEPVDPA
jgi:hypothetical protein